MDEHRPIVLTPGEPAGCGPDLLIKQFLEQPNPDVIAICDPELLEARARQLGIAIDLALYSESAHHIDIPANTLPVLPVPLAVPVTTGELNKANADYVLECLRIACEGCMEQRFSAMVTGPVQKSIINEAGIAFSGHTEYLAELCDAYPVMMLANQQLRVALVTTHLPLQQVSAAINQETLTETIRIVNHDLQTRFAIASPRILVCGLNPHAGEGGHLGMEEIETITPVIEQLKSSMDIRGPLPADTVFTNEYLNQADVIIAMFHDQGLPALKALGFGNTVNITLGLPIIRTSVDHGTALELAGTGLARHDSLLAATNLAIELTIQQARSSSTQANQ